MIKKVYEPYIRALLGTATRFCDVVVLKRFGVYRRGGREELGAVDEALDDPPEPRVSDVDRDLDTRQRF